MNIIDLFDPENEEHVKAFKIAFETGMWPEWFLYPKRDEGVIFDHNWLHGITWKITQYWLNTKT